MIFRPVADRSAARRRGTALLAAALAAAALGAGARPAAAEGGPCGARAEIVARLGAEFGETPRGYGLQRGTALVEVFASEDTGSWTILITSPDGVSCLLAAGQSWAPAPPRAAAAAGKGA